MVKCALEKLLETEEKQVKFIPNTFFDGIEYLGEFESVRQIYYVYRKGEDFMLVTLSRSKLDSFNVNFISRDCVKYIAGKFEGKIADRKAVEKLKTDLFGGRNEKGFKILYTFYILCVLGMAEKVDEVPPTRGLKFRIVKRVDNV